MKVAQRANHLVEQRPCNGLVQRTELQDLAEVVRRVLKHQPRTIFSLPRLLVNAVLDALVKLDDMRMLQLRQNTGLLLEDGAQHLRGVCVILGRKLDGIELSVKRSQLDSNYLSSYLPKVPSPKVSMIWYLS